MTVAGLVCVRVSVRGSVLEIGRCTSHSFFPGVWVQMWMEHFGISIVESMAAGLIMIAHNSGGPKSDIIVPLDGANNKNKNKTTGFLASTADEYAERMHQVLSMDAREAAEIRRNARESAKRFTDEVFAESFRDAMAELNLL